MPDGAPAGAPVPAIRGGAQYACAAMAKPYDPKDFYFRKAKKEGLRARSAFKIDEILERHHLLAAGRAVLDLGAAPGGFLQVIAETVGPKNWALMHGPLRLADTGSLTRDIRVALHTLRPDKVEKKIRNTMNRLRERGHEAGAEEYFRHILSEINREKLEQCWRTDLAGAKQHPSRIGEANCQ